MVSTFVTGFVAAFTGFMPPGMLNMLGVKLSVSSGRMNSFWFGTGAATTIGIQSIIATQVFKLLANNPSIVETLQSLAIGVFLLLAFYFYTLSRKTSATDKKMLFSNAYLSGLVMATFNMMAIPFFVGVLIARNANFDIVGSMTFGIGAMLGALGLFTIYNFAAAFVSTRVGFVTRNINLILCALFLFLAAMLFIRKFM